MSLLQATSLMFFHIMILFILGHYLYITMKTNWLFRMPIATPVKFFEPLDGVGYWVELYAARQPCLPESVTDWPSAHWSQACRMPVWHYGMYGLTVATSVCLSVMLFVPWNMTCLRFPPFIAVSFWRLIRKYDFVPAKVVFEASVICLGRGFFQAVILTSV